MDKFILFAFLAACLELAFQEYMDDDMIFERYKYYIDGLSRKRGWKRKLSFILGKCRYCNGFWVAMGIYVLVYHKIISIDHWWMMLLFGGLNYIFIKLLTGIIKKLYS
jgi:hypothetical protein